MASPEKSALGGERACPDCDARLKTTDEKCWLCGRRVVVGEELPRPPVSPQLGRATPGQVQFSLESLFLVITLAAVCLGALVTSPPLGVLVLIVATPALIRTLVEGHYARQSGRPLTIGEKLLAFVASTGISLAALIAAGGAFFAACTGSVISIGIATELTSGSVFNRALGVVLIWGSVALCLLVTAATFGGMLWMMRPKKR